MRVGQVSFIVFISKIVGSAIGFLATLYFARVLGAEVYGFYALVLSILAWLEFGSKIGINSAVTKRLSEDTERGEHLTAGILMMGGTTALATVLLFSFREQVNAYVGREVAVVLIPLLIIVMMYTVIEATLEGQRDVHLSGMLSTVKIAVRSLIQIALVLLGFQLIGLLGGYILGGLFFVLFSLFFVSVSPSIPTMWHFRSLYDYAKFAWLGKLESRSFNDVDIILLGFFVSPALVGIYAIAWSLSQFLSVFGSAVRKTMFPEISRESARDEDKHVSQLITDSLAFGGLIVIPGVVGGSLLADRLLLLYGDEFVEGAAVLGILILSVLLRGYHKQLTNGLNATDRPQISFRINIVVVIANIGLNIVLVMAYGILGAAIATALSAFIGMVLGYISLRQFIQFELPIGELSRQISAAVLMGILVYGAEGVLQAAPIALGNTVIVVSLVCLGAGAYFTALLVISTRFRRVVTDNLPENIRQISG